MDFVKSRRLLQKAWSYKCQLCTKVCASSRLVVVISQVKWWSNKIEKLPDIFQSKCWNNMQFQTQASLQRLKIYSTKGCSQSKMYILYVCIYIANTAILKLRIFSGRYHFRLWIFASTSEYFYYWHWRALPKVL